MSDADTSAPDNAVREVLEPARLAERADTLGFADQDRADLLEAAGAVRADPVAVAAVGVLAGRLRARVGAFATDGEARPWSALPAGVSEPASGVLAVLALLATAPAVTAFHVEHDVPTAVSAATLADLGQQVAVHRLTYDAFGLHTQDWLSLAWSGALYALGRLQYALQHDPAESGDDPTWVLAAHIPATGALAPDEVDESLAAAGPFFARCFPDHPVRDVVCHSWLLDPALAEAVPGTNLAAFSRRWTLEGEPDPGDEDVLFFAFHRRGEVDRTTLPADTALRRAVLTRWADGGHWSLRHGRIPGAAA